MAALFWIIWKHRNVKVWKDITETCVMVVERARSMVKDWKLANVPCANRQAAPTANHITTATHATSVVTAVVQVHWQPLAQGPMKCNIDAAFQTIVIEPALVFVSEMKVVCLYWPKQSALLVFTRLILARLWVFITPCNG